jgi:hypothetical protein
LRHLGATAFLDSDHRILDTSGQGLPAVKQLCNTLEQSLFKRVESVSRGQLLLGTFLQLA